MKHVGFPGLGLDFNFNPIAISIGDITIKWYGIIICVGVIAAFIYFLRRGTKTERLSSDDIYNITIFATIFGIIGARFLYVVTNLDKFDTFLEMINIPGGGLAIYGGIIFGLASILIYCKIKHVAVLSVLDAVAPAVMIGQVIGRWGNFINAEAYGYSSIVEKLPWRMVVDDIEIDGVLRPDIEFVHPTFLYESLWNLIGFVLINIIYRKKKFDGQIFALYIGWYGLGRAFLEMLRTDSLMVFGLKLMIVLGFASVVAAVYIYIILYHRSRKESLTLEGFESKFHAEDIEAESGETDEVEEIEINAEQPEGAAEVKEPE